MIALPVSFPPFTFVRSEIIFEFLKKGNEEEKKYILSSDLLINNDFYPFRFPVLTSAPNKRVSKRDILIEKAERRRKILTPTLYSFLHAPCFSILSAP